MSFLAWQRRARAIAAHIAAMPEEQRASALVHASIALIERSCALAGGRSLAEVSPNDPLAHWLTGESLDAELRALAERHGSTSAAPFVHEHLEHATDPRSRVGSNRYATPSPVADWMAREAVRAAQQLSLGSSLDPWIALDPACGAGALLVALARVAPSLRKSLYGIERDPVVARCAAAHLRAQLALDDAHERVMIADALEGPWSVEAQRDAVLIVANPPFAADEPMNPWLRALTYGRDPRSPASYRAADGERSPRNSKWLDSLQLRFLRWIHGECDRAERAVAVVALGHAWVDHRTFACVRRALCASFDAVSIVDLHGAARHGLHTPDGARDQNVFEIQQGVCLLVLVRDRRNTGGARCRRADLWGTRERKFAALETDAIAWSEVSPSAPAFRFEARAHVEATRDDSEQAWSEMTDVTEVFEKSAPAIITGRDAFVLGFCREDCEATVRWIADGATTDDALRAKVRGALSVSELEALRERARRGALSIARWTYRPWDIRWAIDDDTLVDRPRPGTVMDALRTEKTLAIVTRRQSPPERAWNYLFVTALPACDGVLRADPHGTEVLFSRERLERDALVANVRQQWLRSLSERIQVDASDALWREAFEYIVGRLSDARYQQRFCRQLATATPRIPWPRDRDELSRWAQCGAERIATHTAAMAPEPTLRWRAREGSLIERARWTESDERLWLSEHAWIEGVRAGDVAWTIGARRPALRWLEDRVGQPLSRAMMDTYATLVARVRAERDDG